MTRRKPGAVIGRPKGPPNPAARTQRLTIRVNAEDLEILDAVARHVGLDAEAPLPGQWRGETLRQALRHWARSMGLPW